MATGGECSFVNFTTPTSKEERLQNLYLIRSRTVKINRRKQLLRTSREQEDYSSRKIAGPGRKLLPAGSQPPSSRKIDVDEYVKVRGVTTVHERILLAKDEHRQCQGRELQNNSLDSSLVLPSPVSPFFGALATSTFDSSSHSAVSEISSRGWQSHPVISLLPPLTERSSLQHPPLPRLRPNRNICLLPSLLPKPPSLLQLRTPPPLRPRQRAQPTQHHRRARENSKILVEHQNLCHAAGSSPFTARRGYRACAAGDDAHGQAPRRR